MQSRRQGSSLKAGITNPRSLILVGVFSALYIAGAFIPGMLGFVAPFMMFVGWALSMLINGVVVMLYLSKVPQLGALSLLGLIVGLFMVITGHVWFTVLVAVALGAIGDLIAAAGGHRPLANALAYSVFNLWFIAPISPIFYNSDDYYRHIEQSMKSPEYAAAMRELFTPTVIGVWVVLAFALSFGAALVGVRMVNKHFARAGVA